MLIATKCHVEKLNTTITLKGLVRSVFFVDVSFQSEQ